MRIEYLCHACLHIDTGDVKIGTDPWFHGPAYCGQWNVFPKPVNTGILAGADVILLSHGHEDHFHVPTLQTLPQSARVLYPYNWYGGVKPLLNELGFQNVQEAPTHKTLPLTRRTSVTYITNNLDSIIIIESDGQVFVNLNDALHAYPAKIADIFIDKIRERWPKIDAVFCGFGGASYFPNTVHCPGKNDKEVALAREQMFVHSFCRIVRGLNPAVAVPFAVDFALLGKHQRWINEMRIPCSKVPDYYRRLYGECDSPRIEVMYPGDVLIDTELLPVSPYRRELRAGTLTHLIEREYQEEIAELEHESWLSEGQMKTLQKRLLEHLQQRRKRFDPELLARIEFSLKITDTRDAPYLNISMKSAEPRIERSQTPSADSILELATTSRILEHSLTSEWGGDAITIGYGCEIQVYDEEIIKTGLDSVCVQLLTRTPSASRHWKREPVRMVRHILSSPFNRTWAAQAAWAHLKGRPTPNNEYNSTVREWLLRTKCEVCGACDLPMLDDKFASIL